MNIMIREANEDDLPSIIDLYAQPEMDGDHTIKLDDAKKIFNKTKSYPYYKFFIAFNQEKPVGTFSLTILDNLVHNGALSAVVEAVAVDPHSQGQGIGKFMMKFAMTECKKMGCGKLSLSTNIRRKQAHQFYESLGFKQHGICYVVE